MPLARVAAPPSLTAWDDLGRARAALEGGAGRVVLEGLSKTNRTE